MSNQPITTAAAVYIEADDDSSSGYESTTYGSSTDSLASSLNKYYEENGRKYHAYYGQDKNFMPVDDLEKERLDIQHEVFRLVSGSKLHHAPLKNPQRVLDLGAGTGASLRSLHSRAIARVGSSRETLGIWSIDFADAHPQAEVTGVDLRSVVSVVPANKVYTDGGSSPIQPRWVPPNWSVTRIPAP